MASKGAPKCGKATAWMFTLNNPTAEDDPRKWPDVRYAKWQLEEAPTTKTPHYQGYVEFTKQHRLSGVRKIASAHWEMRAGSQQDAIDYVSKEDTRIDGPWEVGKEAPGQGSRSDLQLMCELVAEGATMSTVAKSNMAQYVVHHRGLNVLSQTIGESYTHDDVRGIWYWGKPGAGKSYLAREEYPGAYLKPQNKWFDGYEGEDAIILDDLDKLGGDKLGHYLKIWADRYACSAEVKGAKVNLKHKVFVITSNYTPDDMWPDDNEMLEAIRRRFKVIEIKKLEKSDCTTGEKRKRDDNPHPCARADASSEPMRKRAALMPFCGEYTAPESDNSLSAL